MAKTFIIGIAAALISALGLMVGGALGILFSNTLLAVGGGLILGMVRRGTPLGRLAGYVIGLVLGVLFAALRLGLIPGGESVLGAAIALAVILVVIGLVSGLSRNHISSWSMLLGTLVFVSGFIAITEAAPWTANVAVVGFFLSTLVMSAIGFLVVIVVEFVADVPALNNYGAHRHSTEPGEATGSGTEEADSSNNQSNDVQTDLQGIVGEAK